MKNTFAGLAAIGLITVLSAGNAAAVTTFDFATQANNTSGSAGNSLSMTAGGITLTETAWWINSTASTPASNSTFATASVQAFNGYGLGVCNGNDYTSGSCGSPAHQMDNSNGYDFLLLVFSTPVNISNITTMHYAAAVSGSGDDADMTYWKLNSGLTAGAQYSTVGTGTTVNTSISCAGTSCLQSNSVSLTNVTYLLIATATTNPDSTKDAFKLKSLDVSVAATPEPGTVAMLGSGLLACAAYVRRRKNQKKTATL